MSAEATELVVNGRLFAYADGGIQRYAHQLVRALTRSDAIKWKVAIPAGVIDRVDYVPTANRLVLPVPAARGFILPEMIWNQSLSTWIRRHCPRALLHNVFHFWAPRPPRRTLVTAHDCFETHDPHPMVSVRLRLHRRIAHLSTQRAQRVIAVSEWTRQEMIKKVRVSPDRVVTIYNWLDPRWETPPTWDAIARARQRYRLPSRYAVYVGGFREYKNVGLLLRAWALGRRTPDWPPLVLAGTLPTAGRDATMASVEAGMAAAGLTAGEVCCPGAIAEADLPALYAGAAVFVSASRQEGFGYPAVEATACGTPVVVADASAFRETVPDAHQRFDLGRPENILERVSAALARPEDFRRKLDPRFTERHGFGRYLELIRDLAGPDGRVRDRGGRRSVDEVGPPWGKSG